jgi:hypothetical protein
MLLRPILSAALVFALAPLCATAQAPMKQDGAMAMDHAKPPVPPSKSVAVTFGAKTITLTMDDLLKLPQVTVHVHNAHRNTDETYSGPLVSDVLSRAGLAASKDTEPTILHSSLVATGTDRYFVLYSAAEAEPSFSTGQVIVAVMKSGQPNTEGGAIQLVNTVDAKPARWIHGLASLSVMTLAPNN